MNNQKPITLILAVITSVVMLSSYAQLVIGEEGEENLLQIDLLKTVNLVDGNIVDMTIFNDYAYIITRKNSSLQVIDISNPEAAERVGGYKFQLPFFPISVTVNEVDINTPSEESLSKIYAYVVFKSKLEIIDVSIPDNISVIGEYIPPSNFNFKNDLYVEENNLMFIISADKLTKLVFLDISNLTNITITNIIPLDCCFWIPKIIRLGNHLFVPMSTSQSTMIELINLTQRNDITMQFIDNPIRNYDYYKNYLVATYLFKKNSYERTDHPRELNIYNIRNLANISKISSIKFNETSIPINIDVSDYFTFIADRKYGILIYDIINPTTPNNILINYFPLRPYKVIVDKNFLYVGDEGNNTIPGRILIFKIINNRRPPDLTFFEDELNIDKHTIFYGNPINVKTEIINIGRGPSPPSDVLVKVNNKVIDHVFIPSLDVDEKWKIEFDLNIDNIGKNDIQIIIDPDDLITESNENNNELATGVMIIELITTIPSFTINIYEIIIISSLISYHSSKYSSKKKQVVIISKYLSS